MKAKLLAIVGLILLGALPAPAQTVALLDLQGLSEGSDYSWHVYTYTVTAVGNASAISFFFRNDPWYSGLDSVQVTAVGGGPNLVTNGGFEAGTGNAPGWTRLGQVDVSSGGTATGGNLVGPVLEGNLLWQDGATGGEDGIGQLISTHGCPVMSN